LYYYRARYYSPLLGRFINEDPIGFVGGLNFYSYVFDSPTNLTDPSGNCPMCPVLPPVAAGAASGVGTGVSLSIGVGEGTAPVFILVAEGSAAGSNAGLVGALVGAGLAATVGIVNARMDYNQAVDGAQAAFDQEMQSRDRMNQQMVQQKKAQSLAGRYTGRQPGNGDDDCPKKWEDAYAYCAYLNSMPRKSPEWKKYLNLWGGNYSRCVRGQVPERCGGNFVE
jgi:uncharacterized protein RhaS with RHS repeats